MDPADQADARPVCYLCPRPVRPPATLCDACVAVTAAADELAVGEAS